ncbi:hypothetical protein PISL3812_09114 [Talaromyces islandicus]|uniref:Rhamnogalacturonase A/B/Epimerase-like pectate lyase domain-containing protein n=1 Tax=Talaromyces islandicus TaxID=28573 RepID=A0A0U1M910_TALIS|nr:hypothetical protein PISL3812_09114 [Talaromyces islandicus]
MKLFGFILLGLAPTAALAQLTGKVGPLVSFKDKAKNKTCDITDYGAKDGTSDASDAINSAWKDCKVGGLVYIPPGTYGIEHGVSLTGGVSSAVQLDGTLTRHGKGDSNQMVIVKGCSDFEFFSGNSKGAIQGYGYEYLRDGKYGERLFRFEDLEDFSVHGIAAIDSPAYYFVFDTVSNGEIYNILIRGITVLGATDGIDVWGNNVWVHDIEATNGDECVTVKSPSNNILIESIYCNLSGGTALGSLGLDTNITNIHYRNLYMNDADACFLKTNGGSGTVSNILWENVIVHGGSYPLTIDEAWGRDNGGHGVQVSNLTFRDWYGTNKDTSRPAIRLECDPHVPCYDITLDNVNIWTDKGSHVYWSCENVYGSGACMKKADSTSHLSTFTTTVSITAKPTLSMPTMSGDLTTPPPTTTSFTIPKMPTSFYPGVSQISTLLSLDSAGGL